ncbi:MAG: putative quinol monooxygenase [Parvularcula sp.]|jgi:quinol monooxygenase YgiN|nr:putative quinol monooxygenase [Parvularcula sp.]
MTDPLCIIATITPRAEHLADARDAILGIIDRTLAEPGCRAFRLLQGEDGLLRLYEEWDDEAALEAHYAEDYTRAVFTAYEGWLAMPPDIVRLRRLG